LEWFGWVNVGRMRRLLSPNKEAFDSSAPKRALIPQTLTPLFFLPKCGNENKPLDKKAREKEIQKIWKLS